MQQRSKLPRVPLQRLLSILEVNFENTDDTPVPKLRTYLKKFITTLRQDVQELEKSTLADIGKNKAMDTS